MKQEWGKQPWTKMSWAKQPWRLVPNKIVRYPGGREIDRFRGLPRGRRSA
ncbi:MAG TPA: hypothetical protein H9691_01915 [Firmicutes bacterium]|nr:hypothetical protein [Bacillota bacterium]